MTDTGTFVLEEIEPEIATKIVVSRRQIFAKYRRLALVGSVPTLLAMAATEAFGQSGLPQQVVDVLNYALSLEHFEATFTAGGALSDQA